MYLYMPIGTLTVNEDSYVVPTNGLESKYPIEALDRLIGISVNRYTDGVLDSSDPEFPAYLNSTKDAIKDPEGGPDINLGGGGFSTTATQTASAGAAVSITGTSTDTDISGEYVISATGIAPLLRLKSNDTTVGNIGSATHSTVLAKAGIANLDVTYNSSLITATVQTTIAPTYVFKNVFQDVNNTAYANSSEEYIITAGTIPKITKTDTVVDSSGDFTIYDTKELSVYSYTDTVSVAKTTEHSGHIERYIDSSTGSLNINAQNDYTVGTNNRTSQIYQEIDQSNGITQHQLRTLVTSPGDAAIDGRLTLKTAANGGNTAVSAEISVTGADLVLTVPMATNSTNAPALGSTAPVAGLTITKWIKARIGGVDGYIPFFSL